jgi:group I intron endonuclease
MSQIYLTKNLINGKIYVGKTDGKRSNYLGSGIKLSNAIKKYGIDSFRRIILETCPDEKDSEREKYWIKVFNSRDDRVGYNISEGGEGGAHYWNTLTDEEKIEHRKKISESKKDVSRGLHLDKTKEKMSQTWRKIFKDDPDFIFKRAAKKRKSYTCVNHLTNEIFFTNNLKEFCKDHNLNHGTMQHNSRNRKTFCNGTWSCSYETFNNMSDTDIINYLANEVNINNLAYRKKISQARKNRQ